MTVSFIDYKHIFVRFNSKKLITAIRFKYLKLFQCFQQTDSLLQTIKVWPKLKNVEFFDSKLKFQIKHSIFRTKVSERLSLYILDLFIIGINVAI